MGATASSPEFPLTKRQEKFGWRPDLPDHRDKHAQFPKISEFKILVDLRSNLPKIYDQGALGSCTANAVAAIFEYEQVRQQLKDFMPSRLFIYYNERVIEGTTDFDSGASIRDGIKTLNRIGTCTEETWPYHIVSFKVPPSPEAYQEAEEHKSILYNRVPQTEEALKTALTLEYPVAFGFTIFESFMDPEKWSCDRMPDPKPNEKILGGHAVVLCGFDNVNRLFLVRNSWGEQWGTDGYFWMPFDFCVDRKYCSDFWVIEKVNDGSSHKSIVGYKIRD